MRKRRHTLISPILVSVTLLSIIALGSGMVGFALGRATIETTPVEPITPKLEIIQDPAPEAVYYDCPLDNDIQDYIRELCDQKDIPMSLVIAMIKIESGFRADVVSGTNDYGLMQINSINHNWLSEKYGITDFLNPYQNIKCGVEMISSLYHKYGTSKGLMAYNLGETGAKRRWENGTYETEYSVKIMSAMEEYENEIKS